MENRTVDAHLQENDSIETTLRPASLDEYIGQKDLKENLKVFINAAKQRNEALDHVLLYGPPGLGKTTLAYILANEMHGNLKTTSGPSIEKSGDLAAILSTLEPGDVLFIDEIHRLAKQVEEVLYPAMEDYCLDIIVGKDSATTHNIRLSLPPFTLVGATTRAGDLSAPLRDRFGIPLRLEFYTQSELQMIVTKNADQLGISIDPEGAAEIARRSRGTPRIACRLLRRARDFAIVVGCDVISREVADTALKKLDVDEIGLDSMDRKYLKCICDFYDGGPVGVETLAAVLSEKRDTIEEVIEPYILQNGLIQRTARGRVLTIEGYKYLGVMPKHNDVAEGELF